MPRTLADLAKAMLELADTLPGVASNNLSVEAVEIILTDLIANTPVDTGRAVSNWQVAFAPITEVIDAYYLGAKGSTAIVNQTAALEEGMRVARTKKPGQTLYIGNAVPYIRYLNDGTDRMAPLGFIERAVLLGRLFTENPADFAPVG